MSADERVTFHDVIAGPSCDWTRIVPAGRAARKIQSSHSIIIVGKWI